MAPFMIGWRDRPQLVIAAVIAAAATALLVLLKLASEILEGEFDAYDRAALIWIRDHLGGVAGLRAVMLDLTALGDTATLLLVMAFAAGLWAMMGARRVALILCGQAILGTLVVQGVKAIADRARPDAVPHWASFSAASFPSGRAALSAIVYLTLAVVAADRLPSVASKRYLMSGAVLLVVAIGFSRLYLGVHWPTDVLAGWALGGSWAILSWLLCRRLG